VKSSA